MIPMQILTLEHDVGYYCEHSKTDTFLHHFQLYEREGTTVSFKAHAVGGHLTAVFKEGYCPRKDDDAYQRPLRNACILL